MLIFLYYFLICINYELCFGIHDFLFENFVIIDYFFIYFKFITILLSLIILLLSRNIIYSSKENILKEFILLFLLSIFFMLMLLSSNDFFFGYLSLEGMSFSLYILAASVYYSRLSIESSLKYFILGGVASSLLFNFCNVMSKSYYLKLFHNIVKIRKIKYILSLDFKII